MNQVTDKYLDGYRKAVKSAKNKKELDTVLNKLYEDGFEDGANEGRE